MTGVTETEVAMGEIKSYGYVRVSTQMQKEDRQLVAMRETGVPGNRIYADKLTGCDFERPQYKRLLRNLGEGDVLYVKSLDRLGRNYEELKEQWRIITKEKKADIVVLDLPILDTRREKNLLGNLISDLVLALLSYVAENEHANIKQRQAEGIAAARERGVRFGRPPIPLPEGFPKQVRLWRAGEISMKEAAQACNMAPKTFYHKARRYEKSGEK